MPATEVILLPSFLILYHTMRNNNSGSICLGNQSSDGTDATGTSLQNTNWSDYSKVRPLYLYLCNSGQSTEFSQCCVNPSAPYQTASPTSSSSIVRKHLHFSVRHNHSWVFQLLILPNQVYYIRHKDLLSNLEFFGSLTMHTSQRHNTSVQSKIWPSAPVSVGWRMRMLDRKQDRNVKEAQNMYDEKKSRQVP